MDFSNKKEYNRKITFRDPESFSNANDNFMYRKLNSNLSIGMYLNNLKTNLDSTLIYEKNLFALILFFELFKKREKKLNKLTANVLQKFFSKFLYNKII